MKLKDELLLYDCQLTPDQFHLLLTNVWNAMFDEWVVGAEQILYRPHDALQFCEVIRARSKAPLPDQMILRRAVNKRKQTPGPMRADGGDESASLFPSET